MRFIAEYEICALVFLIAAMLRFFVKRQFPGMQNRIFGALLWCAVADLSLDILSAYTIEFAGLIPIWINYVINTVFYLLQIVYPVLILFYTMALAGTLRQQHMRRLLFLTFPAAVTAVFLLAVNPFIGMFFYFVPVSGYHHGGGFDLLYIVSLIYMALILLEVIRHRTSLQKAQSRVIIGFLAVMAAAMSIQALYPPLLITGAALALAIVVMYSTLQNPQDMLDMTTQVFNYRAMLQFIGELIKEGKSFHIIAADIHNVSRINRLFGLDCGNLTLVQVGRFLAQDSDKVWVFRMMGTRFVTITSSESDYAKLRGDISRRFGQPWDIGITEIILSATVCCMRGLDSSKTLDEVVNLLEAAFSSADHNRFPGKVIFTDEGSLADLYRTMAVETALHEALEQGTGLELHLQPIYSVTEKRFVGAEALLRFSHADLGRISPAEFVPIAEKKGLVLQMDKAVVKMGCEFILQYDPKKTLGLDWLGINLSAAEFMNRQMPKRLMALLDTYAIDPGLLMFEITETAATASYDIVSDCLKELREKHIRFALDDFGTGFANISQVAGLPFDYVKIDRDLLMGSRIVLENLMRMFAQLGLRTVVEGVETIEQVEYLHTLQVDCIQGFYYARPMPVEKFVAFMGAL